MCGRPPDLYHTPHHVQMPCYVSNVCVRRGRAPKGKGAAPAEEAVDLDARLTPPAFSEESLAALSFDTDTPYTDPDPQILPSSLEAVVASWQRPSEYLQALVEEGGTPYVVQPLLPDDEGAAVSRELPNLIESVTHVTNEEGNDVAEARRALQWMISCIQLVALHPSRVEEGCFLWELIHPQTDGRPRYVPSGKYAVKLFDQGAWRLVTVDDKIPFDAAGAAILPRSVSRSPPCTHPCPPPACTPSICTPSHLSSFQLHPPPSATRPPYSPRRTPRPPLTCAPSSRLPRCRRRHPSCGLCCLRRPSTSWRPARPQASPRTPQCSCG